MKRILLCVILVALCEFAYPGAGRERSIVELQALLNDLVESQGERRAEVYKALSQSEDAVLVPALIAYQAGLLVVHEGRAAICQRGLDLEEGSQTYALVDAITLERLVGPDGSPLFIRNLSRAEQAPRPERQRINSVVQRLKLFAEDTSESREAIIEAGLRQDGELLPVLKQQLRKSPQAALSVDLREAIARIELARGNREARLAAANTLRELAPLGSNEGILAAREQAKATGDSDLVKRIDEALDAISRYQRQVNMVHHTFAGLSLASILILMALGLSIIFGQMGVINMAHGEFVMIGGFSAYVACEAFKHYLPASAFDFYWLVAIPMAFLVAALVGLICETVLVRRLYGRQLDSLLATWGISLILIQLARVLFGDTTAITPPSWFAGGWEVTHGLVLPRNRLFIIAFCSGCIALVYFLISRTRFGLLLRATSQDRDMAAALGVNVRRIDAFTFAFGTGLAGLAGCALVLFDKLNPQMGQGYIVDSFMVVVVGGVGKLYGVLAAGCGLGFLMKYIEPWLQAVYGKIAVLLLVIAFIQRWPTGLFPDKGRLADD